MTAGPKGTHSPFCVCGEQAEPLYAEQKEHCFSRESFIAVRRARRRFATSDLGGWESSSSSSRVWNRWCRGRHYGETLVDSAVTYRPPPLAGQDHSGGSVGVKRGESFASVLIPTPQGPGIATWISRRPLPVCLVRLPGVEDRATSSSHEMQGHELKQSKLPSSICVWPHLYTLQCFIAGNRNNLVCLKLLNLCVCFTDNSHIKVHW